MEHVPMLLLVLVIGTSLGSFLNVCAYRLPRGISVVSTRSFCPKCYHVLGWVDLLPLLGFFLLGGRCKYCRNKISIKYPLVEASFATLLLLYFVRAGLSVDGLTSLVFAFLMIVVAMVDWHHLVIPNSLILAGLFIWIPLTYFSHLFEFVPLLGSACLASTLTLLARFLGSWLFKKPAMGMGDVKLAALVALYLGFTHFLIALWLAAIIGSSVGFIRMWNFGGTSTSQSGGQEVGLKNSFLQNNEEKLPFGSFMAISAVLAIIFQNQIDSLIGLWWSYLQ